ncbi:MAG TPA: PilZ domain-containing protein [Candidatus Angelobacter sp.]|nr:PilZ domain-containing protein [Candidatus Angelobacter sp.]
MEQTGADPRRWTRHRIDLRLKVSVAGSEAAGPVFGRANNLSRGGLGAYIPHSIAVGSNVLLELSLPNTPQDIKVNAVVKTCDGFRYGLEFGHLPFDVRGIIEKSCAEAPLL